MVMRWGLQINKRPAVVYLPEHPKDRNGSVRRTIPSRGWVGWNFE